MALAVSGETNGPVLLGTVVPLSLIGLMGLALAHALRGAMLPVRMSVLISRRLSHFVAYARDLVVPMCLNLGVNVVGVKMRDASLRAVGYSPSLVTVHSARIVTAVVMLVAPVMQGAGIVELPLTVILQQAGTPAAAILVAILICRIAQFWFPLALGGPVYLIPHPLLPPTSWLGLAAAAAAGAATLAALLVPKLTSVGAYFWPSRIPGGPPVDRSLVTG